MKILWLSDSPTVPSGFANVTRYVCKRLVDLGYDVHILDWQNTGLLREWQGATMYGMGWHPLGADVLQGHLQRIRPDYLITLADVWRPTFIADAAVQQFLENLPRYAGFATLRLTAIGQTARCRQAGLSVSRVQTPSGHEPLWTENCRARRRARMRVSSNGVPYEYIPHGGDTSLFIRKMAACKVRT